MPTRFQPSAKLLCVIQLAAGALLIAACGGSSSTRSEIVPARQSAPNEPRPHATAQAHRDLVTHGAIVQRPVPGTGAKEINDDNPGAADSGSEVAGQRPPAGQSNPCTLVSKAEAQAIVGRPMATPQEAPLGPTCIYQPVGAKNFVALAIESTDFTKVMPQVRNRTRVDVRGRTAYCGTYGQPTTFVPLGRGRVLNVTALCPIGIQFAAEALPHLKT